MKNVESNAQKVKGVLEKPVLTNQCTIVITSLGDQSQPLTLFIDRVVVAGDSFRRR